MTKKSAGRIARDNHKKELAVGTSTLWSDLENMFTECKNLLRQYGFLLQVLKTDLPSYLSNEDGAVLAECVEQLAKDVIAINDEIEAIGNEHHARKDRKNADISTEDAISDLHTATALNLRYQGILNKHQDLVAPVANRISEIIGRAEERKISLTIKEGETVTHANGEQLRMVNGKLVPDDAGTVSDIEVIESKLH